jgi:uncharacterized membrane protein
MNSEESILELKTNRVEALSDGIFAIAMTILIFGFEIIFQQPAQVGGQAFVGMMHDLWPDFLHYVEGFIILGAFWMEHHHQFHYIKKTDQKLLFINIVAFMFISLIPVSTVIVGDYGYLREASILFEVNLLTAGVVFYTHWSYATSRRRLTNANLNYRIVRFYKRRNLVIPAVSLIAICVSLFSPRFGTIFYFAVPFILIAYRMHKVPVKDR